MKRVLGLAAAVFTLAGTTAAAQAPPPGADVEGVVVTARRIGVPVWRITRGPSSLVLIADADVPAGGTWRPEQLEAAIRGARSMFVPEFALSGGSRSEAERFRATERDALRLGAAVLEPPLQVRLTRLTAAGELGSRETRTLRRTAERLIEASTARRRGREDGSVIAVRAARRHRVKRTPFKGFTFAEFAETPEEASAREIACLASAVELAENRHADARKRLDAWRRVDVPALAASRLEAARRSCSGVAGPRYAKIEDGVEAVLRGALEEPGVTIAVVPLWSLADPSRLLDRLARDHAIDGPRWRAGAD